MSSGKWKIYTEKLDLESDNRNPGSFCCDFSAISNGHAWEVPKIRRYLNRKDLMDRGNMLGWKPPEITVDRLRVQPQWSEVPYALVYVIRKWLVNTTKLPWRKIFGDFYSMIASDSAAWQNAATVLSFSPEPHLFEQSSIYGQRVEQQHLTIPHLEAEKDGKPGFSRLVSLVSKKFHPFPCSKLDQKDPCPKKSKNPSATWQVTQITSREPWQNSPTNPFDHLGRGSAWASEFHLTGMWFCPKVPKDVGLWDNQKFRGPYFHPHWVTPRCLSH